MELKFLKYIFFYKTILPLIEPYGIEISFLPFGICISAETFNRTLWN